MKKNALLFVLFHGMIFTSALFAQIEKAGSPFDLINLERHQVKLNLVAPGLSYELGIFKNVSASTSFGLGAARYISKNPGPGPVQNPGDYSFGYAWHTRLRWYHNLERRKALGKIVSGNSGNYLAVARSVFWAPVQLSNNLAPPDDFAFAVFGGVYGLQRTYEKGFNFNAELGGGYFDGDGVPNGYGVLLSFSFGWVATKRRAIKPTFD